MKKTAYTRSTEEEKTVNKLPLTGMLMVESITVLKNRGKGVAIALLTNDLLQFANKHGFSGVELNQAVSPFGEQLLRSLVEKYEWTTNGIVPAKTPSFIPDTFRIYGDYKDKGICRIKSVAQLTTWVHAARAVGGCVNDGPEGVAREFLLVGTVGGVNTEIHMSLRLSRTKRHPQSFVDLERKHAIFVASAYSPIY